MYGRFFFGRQFAVSPVMLPLRLRAGGAELVGATDRTGDGPFDGATVYELMAYAASPYIIAVI